MAEVLAKAFSASTPMQIAPSRKVHGWTRRDVVVLKSGDVVNGETSGALPARQQWPWRRFRDRTPSGFQRNLVGIPVLICLVRVA
jgi:hypothetical protein